VSRLRRQLEAMGTALLLIQRLSDDTVWALTCTNDDDAESPSVLNIFVPSSEWPRYQSLLRLGKPTDRSTHEGGEQFLCFRQGTLHVGLIEQEKS
jgi:hypothetical protein